MKKSRSGRGAAIAMAIAATVFTAGALRAAPARPGAVVVLPPETQPASDGSKAEIEQSLQAWKLAWELGEADTYLRFYDKGFKGDAASRAQWEKQRRARLAKKDIAVRLAQLRTRMLDEDEAEVLFVQHYTSGQHQDVGEKRLHLKRVNGLWKITRESWKARAR